MVKATSNLSEISALSTDPGVALQMEIDPKEALQQTIDICTPEPDPSRCRFVFRRTPDLKETETGGNPLCFPATDLNAERDDDPKKCNSKDESCFTQPSLKDVFTSMPVLTGAGYKRICRSDKPSLHTGKYALFLSTRGGAGEIFPACGVNERAMRSLTLENSRTGLNEEAKLSEQKVSYVFSKFAHAIDGCSSEKNGQFSLKFNTDPEALMSAINKFQADIDNHQVPSFITEAEVREIIASFERIFRLDPTIAQNVNTENGVWSSVVVTIVSTGAFVGIMVHMNNKVLEATREATRQTAEMMARSEELQREGLGLSRKQFEAFEKERAGSVAKDPLNQFGMNLTQMARDGKLDPYVGNETTYRGLLAALSQRKKPNPVLLGRPGVGKTAAVAGLAQRLVAGQVSEDVLARLPGLKNAEIWQINLAAFNTPDAKYRSVFEANVNALFEQVATLRGQGRNIWLVIDEAHLVVSAGAAEGTPGLGQAMKKYLDDLKIPMIFATTEQEFEIIKRDGALARRMTELHVPEPTEAETLAILVSRATVEAKERGIEISPETLARIMRTAPARYDEKGRPLANPSRSLDALESVIPWAMIDDPTTQKITPEHVDKWLKSHGSEAGHYGDGSTRSIGEFISEFRLHPLLGKIFETVSDEQVIRMLGELKKKFAYAPSGPVEAALKSASGDTFDGMPVRWIMAKTMILKEDGTRPVHKGVLVTEQAAIVGIAGTRTVKEPADMKGKATKARPSGPESEIAAVPEAKTPFVPDYDVAEARAKFRALPEIGQWYDKAPEDLVDQKIADLRQMFDRGSKPNNPKYELDATLRADTGDKIAGMPVKWVQAVMVVIGVDERGHAAVKYRGELAPDGADLDRYLEDYNKFLRVKGSNAGTPGEQIAFLRDMKRISNIYPAFSRYYRSDSPGYMGDQARDAIHQDWLTSVSVHAGKDRLIALAAMRKRFLQSFIAQTSTFLLSENNRQMAASVFIEFCRQDADLAPFLTQFPDLERLLRQEFELMVHHYFEYPFREKAKIMRGATRFAYGIPIEWVKSWLTIQGQDGRIFYQGANARGRTGGDVIGSTSGRVDEPRAEGQGANVISLVDRLPPREPAKRAEAGPAASAPADSPAEPRPAGVKPAEPMADAVELDEAAIRRQFEEHRLLRDHFATNRDAIVESAMEMVRNEAARGHLSADHVDLATRTLRADALEIFVRQAVRPERAGPARPVKPAKPADVERREAEKGREGRPEDKKGPEGPKL